MDDEIGDEPSRAGEELATWQRALNGNGAAFAALFRQHQPRVYRRALSLVGGTHDAEDVTALSFFELWRRRRAVRVVDGTVLPWLLVTTVNLSRNHSRGDRRYRHLVASLPHGEAPNAETVAVHNIETTLLGVRLNEAIARLGLAGGRGRAVIFSRGQILKTVPESSMIAALTEAVREEAGRRRAQGKRG